MIFQIFSRIHFVILISCIFFTFNANSLQKDHSCGWWAEPEVKPKVWLNNEKERCVVTRTSQEKIILSSLQNKNIFVSDADHKFNGDILELECYGRGCIENNLTLKNESECQIEGRVIYTEVKEPTEVPSWCQLK